MGRGLSITGGDQGTCNKAFLVEPNFRPLYIHLEMDHIVNFITKINGYMEYFIWERLNGYMESMDWNSLRI